MASRRVTPEPDTAQPDPAAADTPAEPDPAASAGSTAAPGRYEFVYPYTVMLADLGREVGAGDVLDWPDGPPNLDQWRPTDAPITTPRES